MSEPGAVQGPKKSNPFVRKAIENGALRAKPSADPVFVHHAEWNGKPGYMPADVRTALLRDKPGPNAPKDWKEAYTRAVKEEAELAQAAADAIFGGKKSEPGNSTAGGEVGKQYLNNNNGVKGKNVPSEINRNGLNDPEAKAEAMMLEKLNSEPPIVW
ncbi:hypothetical protein HZC34_04315 [Candidatus Saganbacteria bacterium]|nr:hypothetical protein [Candidatus Saganbacteria bacterium]